MTYSKKTEWFQLLVAVYDLFLGEANRPPSREIRYSVWPECDQGRDGPAGCTPYLVYGRDIFWGFWAVQMGCL